MSEAKDIIYSALYGLLLAICAWVFISTINPDLVYLKKPSASPEHKDYGCINTGLACVVDGKKCCSEYQTEENMCVDGKCKPAPKRCTSAMISSEYLERDSNDPDFGKDKCKCYDDEEILLDTYDDCQDACKTEGHCGWNFLVVRVNTDRIKWDGDLELWEFIHDSSEEDRNKMYDFFLPMMENGEYLR